MDTTNMEVEVDASDVGNVAADDGTGPDAITEPNKKKTKKYIENHKHL